ncbi:hypothetical protein L218DRAFT_1080530 [Marasmius fiardii PR-910]|nr:hypothetical protein L218DRAFT_1080530 [Marasmius fiardii PR-910]
MPRSPLARFEAHNATPRFNNARSALDHLRKLGGPPRDIDISHIPPRVVTVFEILSVLASDVSEADGPGTARVAAVHIKAKWSTLGPWIKFLIERVGLSQELPLTPEGVEARQRTFSLIPIILMFPDRHDSEALAFIKRTSPYLHSLVAQMWCKSIEENHVSWGFWSRVLVDIGFCEADPNKPIPSAFSSPGPYQRSTELGLMFIRHLKHHTQRIPTMSLEDLEEVEDFLMCLTPATFGDTQCPTNFLTVRQYTIPAYINVVSSLATKRKTLRKVSVDSEEGKCARGVAVVASGFVENLMLDSFYTSIALKSGFFEALFRLPRCIISYENAWTETKTFTYWTRGALGKVSRFLVYPSILHHFLRVRRRIDRLEGLQAKFYTRSLKALWSDWEETKKKASILQELRGRLLQDDSLLCSARQCPLSRKQGNSYEAHWGRCSRCEMVMYCSYTCQRADWKESHKQMCEEFNKTRLAGKPKPGNLDYKFFCAWTSHYLSTHADYIAGSVDTFIQSLSASGRKLSEDQQLIRNRRKYPIVFFDFDKTGVLDPEDCVQILDTTSLAAQAKALSIHSNQYNPEVDVNWTTKIIRIWRELSVDDGRVIVVGSFPMDDVTPWPVHLELQFPSRVQEL